MMGETQKPLAGKASGYVKQRTGDAGSANAVAVCDYTPLLLPASRTKAILVAVLPSLLMWSPPVAKACARLVTACWPGFRGA